MSSAAQERRGLAYLAHLVATHRLHTAALCVGVLASGCMSDEPQVSQSASASTVADYKYSGCSTAVVIGLSKQIAQEADCEHPGHFVAFTASGGITFTSSAVLPYLEQSARDDLEAAAADGSLQVNSGLRTLAQQYLLYQWYLEGRCGITAAATVGNSNHEGGRAVDLENYSTRVTIMANHGWAHDVPGDDVHFDHLASTDHRGEDVHAFQVLWNLNHPGDQIAEDGLYGPQTEARLEQAPATGFAMGPSCTTTKLDADVVSVDGPDMAPPETQVHYAITLKNTGTVTWPATTVLRLASGTSSPLHDASWVSDTVVTTVGGSVAAGDQVQLDFDVTTPAETVATPITQALELNDAGTKFGSFDLSVTVDPGMTGPSSGDGGDQTGDGGGSGAMGGGQAGGGCSAAGGGAQLAPLLVVLAALVRRRRTR